MARCAFGITIESLGNKNDPFVEHARHIFHPPALQSPAIMLPYMFPGLANLFIDRLFVTKHLRFFLDLLDDIIQQERPSKGSAKKYDDFIESLTEAFKGVKKDGTGGPMWTKEEVEELVKGQSTLFMIAAYDSPVNTLTNASYLLAKHPDVQDRLYEAIAARHEDFVNSFDEIS